MTTTTETTETPWENPQVGDVLTMSDGRMRRILEAPRVHGRNWIRWTGIGPTGRRITTYCERTTWRKEVEYFLRRGGSYVRAGGEA